MTQEELFKKLVAHCKEYGFVFPSSEIYDGLGAVYDYGQNGVELKVTLEAFGQDHKKQILDHLVEAGYQVKEVDTADFYN